MLEDKLLLLKLKRGSAEALQRIYEKYKAELLALAIVLSTDRTAAEGREIYRRKKMRLGIRCRYAGPGNSSRRPDSQTRLAGCCPPGRGIDLCKPRPP